MRITVTVQLDDHTHPSLARRLSRFLDQRAQIAGQIAIGPRTALTDKIDAKICEHRSPGNTEFVP